MRAIKEMIVNLGKDLQVIKVVIILLLKSGKFGSFSFIDYMESIYLLIWLIY